MQHLPSKTNPIIHAYAWASGRIDFTSPKRRPNVPQGALRIATAPRRKLKQIIDVIARHGQGASHGMYLVPGIPEAEFLGTDPLEALFEFRRQAERRLKK